MVGVSDGGCRGQSIKEQLLVLVLVLVKLELLRAF